MDDCRVTRRTFLTVLQVSVTFALQMMTDWDAAVSAASPLSLSLIDDACSSLWMKRLCWQCSKAFSQCSWCCNATGIPNSQQVGEARVQSITLSWTCFRMACAWRRSCNACVMLPASAMPTAKGFGNFLLMKLFVSSEKTFSDSKHLLMLTLGTNKVFHGSWTHPKQQCVAAASSWSWPGISSRVVTAFWSHWRAWSCSPFFLKEWTKIGQEGSNSSCCLSSGTLGVNTPGLGTLTRLITPCCYCSSETRLARRVSLTQLTAFTQLSNSQTAMPDCSTTKLWLLDIVIVVRNIGHGNVGLG